MWNNMFLWKVIYLKLKTDPLKKKKKLKADKKKYKLKRKTIGYPSIL